MNRYLLFRLYGPMAAWGDTAVGEYRPSDAQPSRTAVLGLLAAALGIRRDQEDDLNELDRSVEIAVRLDMPGEVLRDYHTTQVPPEGRKLHYYTRADETQSDKLHTILSQRDYRTDSGASVALRQLQADATLLEKWQFALCSPKTILTIRGAQHFKTLVGEVVSQNLDQRPLIFDYQNFLFTHCLSAANDVPHQPHQASRLTQMAAVGG